jgi:hypothetical protein
VVSVVVGATGVPLMSVTGLPEGSVRVTVTPGMPGSDGSWIPLRLVSSKTKLPREAGLK